MKYPVYRFSDVLRALRQRSGLTVLEAAEATRYGNYERWESGQTKVGADHLANIGEAFDVGDELWLLVYAWLLDRYSPFPGEEPVEVSRRIAKRKGSLPTTPFDVGRYSKVALGTMSHGDLALVALAARYGLGHAGADRELFLPPRARSALPESLSRKDSFLGPLYGKVFGDVAKWVAMTYLRAGSKSVRTDVQRQVDRQSLLSPASRGWSRSSPQREILHAAVASGVSTGSPVSPAAWPRRRACSPRIGWSRCVRPRNSRAANR